MPESRNIEVLDLSVIEKIAAGEVVERPAAVVKELCENSIDAEATSIQVVIENAGFSLIKIIDNGTGMTPPNLKKCLLHHATSKIRSADDLFSIGTMGFRGEALGSIGAVSRMSIVSSPDESGLGYSIKSIGGEIPEELEPVPHRRGTTITVEDLFFNVPARKKFMKTQRGEHLALIKMMEQLVLPFPGIHFSLQVDGKMVFDVPVVDRLIDRIAGIAGHTYASALIECQHEESEFALTAFVSSPEHLQERPRFQSLYVNLRRINNDSVQYAVREAFAQFLGHHNRPAFFCFLSIDPSKVDVNVHPTKQQIKFDDERKIFGFVFSTVKKGLGAVMAHRDTLDSGRDEIAHDTNHHEKHDDVAWSAVRAPTGAQHTPESLVTNGDGASLLTEYSQAVPLASAVEETSQTILHFPRTVQAERIAPAADSAQALSQEAKETRWDLIPCYQIHAMFILAPIKKGILLIDQHAAHERILYEQALGKQSGARTASQQLLFPIVIELTPVEKNIVDAGISHFEKFGFSLADFGGNAVSVSAIPAFLGDGMVESTLRDMVRYLLDGRTPGGYDDPYKRFAAAFACGAAIKTGQKLTQEEMNSLLNNLFASENPYICPHGRPTLVRMSLDELSRRFLRQ